MHAVLTKPLDWFSIQLARMTVRSGSAADGQLAAVDELLHRPDFLCHAVGAPRDLAFVSERDFQFDSPLSSGCAENDTTRGRLFRCGEGWRRRPTVVVLHGWNAESSYHVLFPYLAWRLGRAGLNTAMIELPYHAQRKPRRTGVVTNFLSDDLLHVVNAARQAVADTRAIAAWLTEQGCPAVGLWGFSLGAWVSGLAVCADARAQFAVLTTPVARIDRVIEELDFCRPLRRSLNGARVRVEPLSLGTHRLKIAPENVLIVAS